MSDEQPSIPERLASLDDLVQRVERDLTQRIVDAEARLAALTQRIKDAEARLAALSKTENNVDGLVAAIQHHAARLSVLSKHRHSDDGRIFIPLDGP